MIAFFISHPAVFWAFYLGEKFANKITQENCNRVIYTFLALMGVLMFF